MVDWVGLTVPIAYLSLLIGSLATCSSLYRKRKAGTSPFFHPSLPSPPPKTTPYWNRLCSSPLTAKSLSLEPWFPAHLHRDIYLSLLHLEPSSSNGEKTPAVPDSVLKAALLQRAAEDINRIMLIRNQKPALGNLLARGSVGDELWQRFERAEKEIEAELRDVVTEANAFSPNWGNTIFQTANELVQHDLLHKKIGTLQAQGKADREWWDQERASIQSKFMKELDEEPGAAGNKPTTTGGVRTGSDEDAVLVEGGGPAASGSVALQGSTKKRKGKK